MAPSYGGNHPPRPDQALRAMSRAGSGPAPQTTEFIGRLAIIFGTGPNTGLFVYNGQPARGNPPILAITTASADPYGNTVTASAITDSGMPLLMYSGPPAAGNLVVSLAPAAGSDAFGNAYPVDVAVGVAGTSQVELNANANQAFNITSAIAGFLQAVAQFVTNDSNELLPGNAGGLVLGSGATAKMATALLSPLGTTGNQGTGLVLQAMNDGGTDTGLITLGIYSSPDSGTTIVFTPIMALSPYALILYSGASGVTTVTHTSGSGTIPIPTGVTTCKAEAWGPGGGGANGFSQGGGGAGEYAAEPALAVTHAAGVAYVVGSGGAGGAQSNTQSNPGSNGSAASTLTGTSVTVTANVGGGGQFPNGTGGTGSTNTTHFNGGNGGATQGGTGGSGGGSSGGTASAGNNGLGSAGSLGANGGAAVTGGGAGGGGGAGAPHTLTAGLAGGVPGGAGGSGGAGNNSWAAGGAGANGQVRITYSSGAPTILLTAAAAAGTDQFGTAYTAGVTPANQSAPGTPTAGPALYGGSGHLKYVGTDGLAYNTGRQTLTSTGNPQTISSTTPATITGLSAAVGAGTYRIQGVVLAQQGGTAVAQSVQIAGPATTLLNGHSELLSVNTAVTSNYYKHTSLPSTVTTPAWAINAFFLWKFDITATFSAAGTVSAQGAEGTAGDTWSTLVGGYMEILPVT